jgi:hypothetical protein
MLFKCRHRGGESLEASLTASPACGNISVLTSTPYDNNGPEHSQITKHTWKNIDCIQCLHRTVSHYRMPQLKLLMETMDSTTESQ